MSRIGCYNGAAAALCLSVQANYTQEFPERAQQATLDATTERNREMVTSMVECTQESEEEKALKGSDF